MAKATLRDGRVISFPDGLPPEKVKSIISKATADGPKPKAAPEAAPLAAAPTPVAASPAPSPGEPPPLDWENVPLKALRSIGDTTIGAMSSLGNAAADPGGTYNRAVAGVKNAVGAVAADPWGSAKAAGGALLGGLRDTAETAVGTATQLPMIWPGVQMAKEAGIYPKVMQDIEDKAKHNWAERPISTGIGLASVIPVVKGGQALLKTGEALASTPEAVAAATKAVAREAPTGADVMTAKNLHYSDLRTNRNLDPHQWDRTWVKIKQDLDQSGFRESPQARAVVREMIRDRNPEGVTFADAEKIHRMANDLLGSGESGNRRAGAIIKEHMNNYYDNAKAVTPHFQEQVNVARDLGRSHILSEDINEIRRKAQFANQPAKDTANQLRSLIRSRKGKGFTPVEEQVFKEITKPPGLLGRTLNKMPAWAAGAIGTKIGGPLGGAIGYGGKAAIDELRSAGMAAKVSRGADKLQRVILAGRQAQARALLAAGRAEKAKRLERGARAGLLGFAAPGVDDNSPRPLLGR